MAEQFEINSVNRIKPGIAEATRAVLRRVPDHVLVRHIDDPDVSLLVYLAKQKKIAIKEVGNELGQYRAITIIKRSFDEINTLCVCFGATLYMPATRTDIADIIIHNKISGLRSLVICLEDAVSEDDVPMAISQLSTLLGTLAAEKNAMGLPIGR